MSNLTQYLNVYEFNTKLLGSDNVIHYKGLSTNTIKKLLMYEKEEDPLMEENLMDEIIKSAVISENFNIDEEYVNDRYFLLLKIREATKGSNYSFSFKCSKCEKESQNNININNFVVEKPEEFNDEVKLDSLILHFEYPKRKKQKEIISLIDKKLSDKEKLVEMSLADIISYVRSIKTLDGEEISIDYKELFDFIGNLPEYELEKINEWKKKFDFGVKFNLNTKCKHCGDEKVLNVPMTNFFS